MINGHDDAQGSEFIPEHHSGPSLKTQVTRGKSQDAQFIKLGPELQRHGGTLVEQYVLVC